VDDDGRMRARRERHVGRLLLQAQRSFNARAVEGLRRRGYAGLTLAHLSLLPHLDEEGTRITVLAERAGMTKQGMGQLVQDLERQGFLGRAPDPADGRATLVRFTPAGQVLLADALAVTAEVEAAFAAILGSERLADLRDALLRVVAADRPQT
jgi:DNA-binding MarR family transcriptional regulator